MMQVVYTGIFRKAFVVSNLLLILISCSAQNTFKTVVIGDDPEQSNIGWTDGVCYTPIEEIYEGDILEFNYDTNSVYKMASKRNYQNCDFTDATLLATIDEDPYQYKVTPDDALDENIYFACKVGNNCLDGNQKVMVKVNNDNQLNTASSRVQPTSKYVTDLSFDACDKLNGIGENLLSWDDATKIVIGDDPSQFDIGWTEGVCYNPIKNTHKGDILEFNYGAHNVYKMASKEHHENCNFTDAMLLATVGESPYQYTIRDEDVLDGTIYFACQIGSHCRGGQQRVMVNVQEKLGLGSRQKPESLFSRSLDFCDALQSGDESAAVSSNSRDNAARSQCTEPVLQDDGRYFVSCLSGPATMTPGGVINSLYFMHYPYPLERRVVVGQRSWEFVAGDPIDGSNDGVIPVPVNQLYVHHLSGRVILGQGTEGIRRSTPDAPFPFPYARMTGDEGDSMVFHIIDLREVDDWLPCIECRCKNNDGTYLDTGGGDGQTGGVDCCSNCTALAGPTIDYRMRYNVSYSDIEEEKPITDLMMLTADISPAAGKNIEYDVPSFKYLSINEQKEGYPQIQRLERNMQFNELFKHEFFGADYYGPKTVKVLRCIGHLHVAAIRMWIEDSETGEIICDGVGGYGSDPNQDKGFLTSITVSNYESEEEMKVIPYNHSVKFITEYDATELHTGVMGMYFIYISSEQSITAEDVQLNIDLCAASTCDFSLLPPTPAEFDESQISDDDTASCVDSIAESQGCQFGGLCDCEEFVNAPESTGCNGVYSSTWGDIEVNSLCAKHCGCPSPPKKSGNNCEDTLAENPACKFGNLCECETLVNSPESTGCNGVYTSDMGNINVNDLCPSYCNACPDMSLDEKLATLYEEHLEDDLSMHCHYSTEVCKNKLSNLISCADKRRGFDTLHPIIQNAVTKNGRKLAVKHSKLGHPSLHLGTDKGKEEGRIQLCSEKMLRDGNNNENVYNEMDEESSSASQGSFNKLLLVLLFSAYYQLHAW